MSAVWQRERRYNRKRDRDCQTEKRKEEYFVSKLERLKSMVPNRAVAALMRPPRFRWFRSSTVKYKRHCLLLP